MRTSAGMAVRQRQGGNAQTPVVIEGDKQARYEAILKVMSELQKAGIERVGLLVEVSQRLRAAVRNDDLVDVEGHAAVARDIDAFVGQVIGHRAISSAALI